jgi:hypothetical protein
MGYGYHPCDHCGSQDNDGDPCPLECESECNQGHEGYYICSRCTVLLHCDLCGEEGCEQCVEEHCDDCERVMCPGCRQRVQRIQFGCGHESCNALVLKPKVGEEEEEEDELTSSQFESLTPTYNPQCAKCQRTQEKAEALSATQADEKQFKEGLPLDMLLVKAIMPKVCTAVYAHEGFQATVSVLRFQRQAGELASSR